MKNVKKSQKVSKIEENGGYTSERASNDLYPVKFSRSCAQAPIFDQFSKISQNFRNSKIANYGETIDILYST